MIFGQINRDHEKHSIPVSAKYIKNSLDIYAKYDVIANNQCMDEHEEDCYATAWQRVLRMNPKKRKVLRPSERVFIRGNQLICHPDLATELEKLLREHTAKLLDMVE